MMGGDTIGGMTSKDLKAEQLAAMKAAVSRELRYLIKMCERMDRVRFDPEDSLYKAAWAARNAVHGLSVTLHYASCESGVGRYG